MDMRQANGVLNGFEALDHGGGASNDVSDWESIQDIETSLADLSRHEAAVTSRLDQLIKAQRDLARDLGRLDLQRAQLGSQAIATRSIGNGLLSNASITATKISSAVKALDLEQARVKGTLDVVEQVAELKACVLGVTGSMGAAQDWETAAGYLNRATKIPPEIVNGAFAEQIVPNSEVPDPPGVTLNHASESLLSLFLKEFEKAAQEGNGNKVTRFFKLFPLIGKSDDGLDVYGRYVCQGVASRARTNLNAGSRGHQREDGFFYATALTKLFEHIAQIVENHGGLVERHYGSGRMVKVIERLQLEADVQGGIVLDAWSEERNIDRRLTDIKSYAFTFLVQSFLPVPSNRSGTPRAGSPSKRGNAADSSDDGSVDMKDVDGFLSEMTVMLGRWSLYSSFIATKCKVSILHLPRDYSDEKQVQTDQSELLKTPGLIANSTLRRKVADRLISPFNTMTTFFFRRSVEKAFQLDEQPTELTLDTNKPLNSNPPFISSAVDDVMYIVNQVVDRSIATSQRAIISSVVPTVARVLGSDFIGMIQRKMRDESYPKAAVQGALPPEQTTITFLVLLNNLDISIDYVKRIVQSRTGSSESETQDSSPALKNHFPLDNDATTVNNTLKSLQGTFEGKASELIGDGIFVVFKNIVKPRLRPLLADAFRDVDYQMTEEELEEIRRAAAAETGNASGADTVVQDRFLEGWTMLTRPLSRILTERNFEKLLVLMVSFLGEVLEKRIWSYFGRLDELGAARLERDVGSVVNAAVRGQKYGLRASFTRCTQICLVMNMEDEEWEELDATTSVQTKDAEEDWAIDREERSRARGMLIRERR